MRLPLWETVRSVCWEVEQFFVRSFWIFELERGRGWNENGLVCVQRRDMLEIYRGVDKEKVRMALCYGCLSLLPLFNPGQSALCVIFQDLYWHQSLPWECGPIQAEVSLADD